MCPRCSGERPFCRYLYLGMDGGLSEYVLSARMECQYFPDVYDFPSRPKRSGCLRSKESIEVCYSFESLWDTHISNDTGTLHRIAGLIVDSWMVLSNEMQGNWQCPGGYLDTVYRAFSIFYCSISMDQRASCSAFEASALPNGNGDVLQ